MRNRGFGKAHDDNHEPSYKIEIPEVKPLNLKTGLIITGGLIVIGLGAGAIIGTQIFFGAVTVVGLVLLAENNKYVKWIIVNGNIWVDLLIFIISIYALFKLGPTVTGGLMFGGVMYSGVVAPAYRERERRRRGLDK